MTCLESSLINDLAEKLVRVTDPETLVLFGDYANDEVVSNSTLDLLLVTQKPFDEKHTRWEAAKRYRPVVESYPFKVNLIIYSADQVRELRHFPNHLVTRVMEEGVTLYERG